MNGFSLLSAQRREISPDLSLRLQCDRKQIQRLKILRNGIDRTIVVRLISEDVDVENVGEYHGEEAKGVSTVRDTSTLLQ